MLSKETIEEEKNDQTTQPKHTGSFPRCDVYELFNSLQLSKCGVSFIDIRSQNDYKQQSIFEAINIPHTILNDSDCDKILNAILKDLLPLSTIYCVVNKNLFETQKDLKFCKFFKNMDEMKSVSIIILNADFNTFYSKFPFLCCSEKEKERKKLLKVVDDGKYQRTIKYPNHILNNGVCSLYLGPMNCASTKYILKHLKITHIVNMTMQSGGI